VLFIDLDGFKQVNDAHGHAAGDSLLRAVGERLSVISRDGDVVARLGGDEFLMLVCLASADQAQLDALCNRVYQQLLAPVSVDGADLKVSGSVGLALFPRDAATGDDLIRVADVAMYSAKQHGRRRAA
jgi:diguanylate cyclase (GGDEF)-like protein